MPRGRTGRGRVGHRHRHHHHHHHHRRHYYGRGGGAPVIVTPSSTPGCLVFEYDKSNKRFSTSNFSTMQIQNRASHEEIERFLNEVNEPIAAWNKEYRDAYEIRGTYLCCLIFFFFLFPLFFCYFCWMLSEQKEAAKKLEEVKEEVRRIIRERGSSFAERGLIWNVPQHFPQWIELWTGAGGLMPGMQPAAQMPGQGGGIQMAVIQQQQPMPQQQGYSMVSQQQYGAGYPGVQQQQHQYVYNPNTYDQQFVKQV